MGLEIVIHVHRHRTPFLSFDRFRHLTGVIRKVANVADACHDAIPVSQEAGKGPGLRGGLDDQQWDGHISSGYQSLLARSRA
jgi:hypothetical protein